MPKPGDLRALVTGAGGFLGQWTTRALSDEGAHVVGLDVAWSPGSGSTCEAVTGDVRDAELVSSVLEAHRIDTVFHLAAQSLVGVALSDPALTFDVNVRGTWAVLDAARRSASEPVVVVASSDKAYGDNGGEPYVESTPLLASDPYSASKACADITARSFATTFGQRVGLTRSANLYGGGDRHWSRLVPGTFRSAVRGERPVIRSDGTFVRDYLYVGDAADALITLAERLHDDGSIVGEAFNFSAEDRASASEIVERILVLLGSELEPDVRNEAVHEIPVQRVDPSKARSVLGWCARTRLDDGLAAAAEWYRANSG